MFGGILGKKKEGGKALSDEETSSQISNEIADGEFLTLVGGLDEDNDAPLTEEVDAVLTRTFSSPSVAALTAPTTDTVAPATTTTDPPSTTTTQYYGHPLTTAQAAALMPLLPSSCADYTDNDVVVQPVQEGHIWNATVIPDVFFIDDATLRRGLNKRDFDLDH